VGWSAACARACCGSLKDKGVEPPGYRCRCRPAHAREIEARRLRQQRLLKETEKRRVYGCLKWIDAACMEGRRREVRPANHKTRR